MIPCHYDRSYHASRLASPLSSHDVFPRLMDAGLDMSVVGIWSRPRRMHITHPHCRRESAGKEVFGSQWAAGASPCDRLLFDSWYLCSGHDV